MKLKRIVLDGFKSYAHRQELDDLDNHFNAITGLNGSGKSNIFDAICFVMGITNLKKVRADDTRDLIYKNGNAGIQRASVTLEFSNEDESSAPPGYNPAEFPSISVARQVICGGKQKFFLNGRLVQQSTIKSFFHSVSMNVDNPHFLVLQGTVHKLLNMKPVEVLSWIEEAAGTRMFDARKRVAEHMIANKDKKLKEIDHTLRFEVAAMIESMGQEQIEYDNYVRISESLQGKRNFRIAHGYWKNLSLIKEYSLSFQNLEQEIHTLRQEHIHELPAKIDHAKAQLNKSSEAQQDTAFSDRVTQMVDALRDKKQLLHKIKAELGVIEKSRIKLENSKKLIIQEAENHERSSAASKSHFEEIDRSFSALKQEKAQIMKKIEDLKASIQLLKSGLQVGEAGMTLLDEQNHVQKEIVMLNQSIYAEEAEVQRMKSSIESLEMRHESLAKQSQDQMESVDSLKKELRDAESMFRSLKENFQSDGTDETKKQFTNLAKERDALIADSRYQLTRFFYRMPEGNRLPDAVKKIRGRLGSFVKAHNPKLHSLALSVGARDNLRKVIVSTGEVAQYLIEKCETKERTTYFVLDAIKRGGKLEASKQQMAHDAVQEQAKKSSESGSSKTPWASLGIDLISYPDDLQHIVEQVFGKFYVCSDLATARAIALGQTKIRAITIDGDSVEPGGTFTGGSSGGLRDILSIFYEGTEKERKVEEINKQLSNLHTVNEKISQAELAVNQSKSKMEAIDYQLRAATSVHAETVESLKALSIERNSLSSRQAQIHQNIINKQSQMASEKERLKQITASLKTDASPEEKKRDFHGKIVAHQKRMNEIGEDLESKQKAYDEQVIHKESQEAKRSTLERRMQDVEQDLQTNENEHAEKQMQFELIQTEIENSSNDLSKLQNNLAEQHRIHKEFSEKYQSLLERDGFVQKALQRAEGQLVANKKVSNNALEQNQEIARLHPFLSSIEDDLGSADSELYYFLDSERTQRTLDALAEDEKTLETLSKRVNKKVKFMIEESKKEYAELIAQRNTLLSDREVILKTIGLVEEKKWRSLDTMVKKVSTGFSNLFGASLPGAECRLVEHRDESKLTGLEVKVSFQGKEKQSLTELSGGQRSLLALCLILAILKFRPAPVYILDEIDAALDPSHTQNIGKMLQTHFRNAQFLLVSLKDGMFNNASVVYEVRHTQGFSEILRRVNG